MKIAILTLATTLSLASAKNEIEYMNEIQIMPGHKKRSHVISPLPHTYLLEEDIPDNHDWRNVDGKNLLTPSKNQHIPHYCGSCWAHGAISSLMDRIRIAQKGVGPDINLSIQFVLNCGSTTAGSCHGGYHTGTYELIKQHGYIPFETCQPYLACSSESQEGFCPHVDTTCNAVNTCRTCSGFSDMGGNCVELDYFPNATVAEYGEVGDDSIFDLFSNPKDKAQKIRAEIYARGPVATTINATPLRDYEGGILDDPTASTSTNHIVSIVGYGKDEESGKDYWIIRNSWGEYWGDMGYAKIVAGKNMMGIEDHVAWVTPGTWTAENVPCSEDGKMCGGEIQNHGGDSSSGDEKNEKVAAPVRTHRFISKEYVDPSVDFLARKEATGSVKASVRTA